MPPALLPEEVPGEPELVLPESGPLVLPKLLLSKLVLPKPVLPEPEDWDPGEAALRRTLLFTSVFKPEDCDPGEATLEASLPYVAVEPED